MYRTALKKFTFGLLVISFILSGFAVVKAAEAPFVDSGRLVFGCYTDVITMDPGIAFLWYESMIARNTYEGLLKYNLKDFSIEPSLAESWKLDEDGGTFHLRKGVKFHDGTEFNAEAVRFTWTRHMAINRAPAIWLKDIKDIKVIDNYTVRIVTAKNWAFLLDVLASHNVFLIASPTEIKKRATEKDPWATKWLHDHTCGTGPYIAKEWVANQYITMVRNKDYWKGWAGKHFSEVVYRVLPEVSSQRMLIQTGEIDLLNSIPAEYYDILEADPNISVKIFPSHTEQYILMNNTRGPFMDKNLRWAATYAMDYDAAREVLRTPAGNMLIGPVYKQDLKKAMEFKNKSAYAGKDVEVSFMWVEGVGYHKKIALIAQDSLKKIGIQAKLKASLWPAWMKELSGNKKEASDMYIYYAAPVVADPYGVLYKVLHSDSLAIGGSNLGYSNPKYDALLDKAATTIDRKKRMALYEEANKLPVDDAAYLWMFMFPYPVIHRDNIKWYPYTEPIDTLAYIFYFYDMYRE